MVRRSRRYLRETLKAYLFLLPSFIVLGIFLFWPLVFSFVLSFFRWDFAHQKNPYFIGLKNYMKLFEMRVHPNFSFLTSISHTLMYLSISVVILVLFHTLFIERRKALRGFVPYTFHRKKESLESIRVSRIDIASGISDEPSFSNSIPDTLDCHLRGDSVFFKKVWLLQTHLRQVLQFNDDTDRVIHRFEEFPASLR